MDTLTFEDRRKVRSFYAQNMPAIKKHPKKWVNKYRFPFLDKMTPIERIAFNECIFAGMIPMYPEFPVGKYFIDLANPHQKIGLELDGLEFHLDWVADAKRDAELWHEHGWKIFRCTGARCSVLMMRPDEEDEDEMRKWLHVTVDGLIYALHRVYRQRMSQRSEIVSLDEWCIEELERSRVIDDFPIL